MLQGTSTIKIGTSISGWYSSLPSGYLPENGQAVSRIVYAKLFSVIGTTYGSGDGSTTFNLPDSRGRVTVNQNASDTEFTTIGQTGGAETHTLTLSEIPPQQLGIRAEYGTNISLSSAPPGQYNQLTTSTAYGFQTAYTQLDGGGGGSHNIIQPSITKLYAIKY